MNNFIFNPIKYEESFFWSFKEVLNPTGSKESYQLDNSDILSIANSMTGFNTSLISNNVWTNENYSKVLDLVVKRFHDHYCFSTMSSEFSIEKQRNFIAKLLTILEMTSPRYLKLLEVYNEAKDELLSPVKIETNRLTRFNDTPQDEGDFANDEHTTNLTEDTGTTNNDLDSKMGRIREIESYYNNLLLNWSNEFESIFLEEANI